MNKKQIRKTFRTDVFTRDRFTCQCCGCKGYDRQGGTDHEAFHKSNDLKPLDAHHIVSRDDMISGGYVASNGISVCDDCHLKCEIFWQTGEIVPGYSPEDLFCKIGSSKENAIRDSQKLS